MPFALQPTSMIPIKVTTDWSTTANIVADIAAALQASFPGVIGTGSPAWDDFTLCLVHPLMTPLGTTGLDKCSITIAAVTAVGTINSAFTSHPAIGEFAYLVDMY